MAEEPTKESKRPKRRVKQPVSIREQRDKQSATKAPKPKRVGRFFHWLGTPFRWIGSWKFWQSKWWKPFRFVGKILGYILFIPYIRSSLVQLRQVTWPSWILSLRLTWAVLVFSIFFGLILAIVDFGLDKLFRKLILNA